MIELKKGIKRTESLGGLITKTDADTDSAGGGNSGFCFKK